MGCGGFQRLGKQHADAIFALDAYAIKQVCQLVGEAFDVFKAIALDIAVCLFNDQGCFCWRFVGMNIADRCAHIKVFWYIPRKGREDVVVVITLF